MQSTHGPTLFLMVGLPGAGKTAIEALRLQLSVILDFGLWGRDERSALRWIAASVGASCQVIYLPVDREVQLRRVRRRWQLTPEQTFPITEAELDDWRSQFDIPDADELSNLSLPCPSATAHECAYGCTKEPAARRIANRMMPAQSSRCRCSALIFMSLQ